MRQETIIRTLYRFEELNEDAKEKAREWFRTDFDFSWSDESLESIKTFCAAFDVTLRDWSVGPYQHNFYKTNATPENFRGRKLRDFNRDHMPTGYCLDCDLWQTFYDEFKKTGDAKHAFEKALNAGFKAWRDDMEYQLSDEAIDETIIMNEYEFTENGKIA